MLQRHAHRRSGRTILVCVLGLILLFILANGILAVVYANRTYPRTKIVNTTIGSVPYSDLIEKTNELNILPASLELVHGQQKTYVKLNALGMSKDTQRTVTSAKQQRSWLPVLNLFRSPRLFAPIKINTPVLNQESITLSRLFKAAPTSSHLVIVAGHVSVQSGNDGYSLDKATLGQRLTATLDQGQTVVSVPVTAIPPSNTANLASQQKEIQAQLDTSFTFTYNGQTKQTTASDSASWYIASGNTYATKVGLIEVYLGKVGSNFGIHIKDLSQIAQTISQDLMQHKGATFALENQTALRTYTYCVNTKGVSADVLPALEAKLKSTYNDPRGWNMNGELAFEQVSSGCQYTVWMAASNQMTSFGTICDDYYNCQVGTNVILNYNRWTMATPPWNSTGGSIDDYHTLMIDHETGHRLGFLDNPTCPGVGQPAPVMMQQSINLKGCVFNVWPLQSEFNYLANTLLGLPAVTPITPANE